jgi:6-phosphogluconolactonase (cycloisomerase 2 family)
MLAATSVAVIVAVLAALVLVRGSARTAFGATGLNLVYVDSNISGANGTCSANCNSVVGYSNDGAGNLTPLPGSPYLTGGEGVAWAPPASDALIDGEQQVIVNPEGTQLFAVNAHTNTVAAFLINSDGSLTAASGSPFPSGGQEPISVGLKDLGGGRSHLIVVNKNSDPTQTGGVPNYTTFNTSSAGVMKMNAGSTYNLPAGTSPAQALTRPKGSSLFGIEFLGNDVAGYRYNSNGTLTQLSKTTPPGTSPSPLGAVLHPTLGVFYVGLPFQSQIAVYSISAGVATFVKAVSNPGKIVCWLAVNSAGTRLYAAETGSGTVSTYDITKAVSPNHLQQITLSGTGALPTNLALDTTGNFLYCVDRKNVLHVINVESDGTLSETLTPVALPTPAGTVPMGVAVLSK